MLNIDNNVSVCALFMDLKKAFDCVDYVILKNKLYGIAIRGNVLNLIIFYLKKRKQATLITKLCARK